MIENINIAELDSLHKKNGEILDCNEWNRLVSIINYIIEFYNHYPTKLSLFENDIIGLFKGEDGFSPTATVTKAGKVATITITDKNGTTTAQINDGVGGQGSDDMLKETYDANNNGIVDNAEKVNNHTVNSDVPENAVFTDTTYSEATTSTAGLMSASDKEKLDGIEEGANVNVQADWNENDSSKDNYIKNKPVIPQLPDPYNGHQYVDLGLPSGTLWATMNVGASSETDYGNYYQYGKGVALYLATVNDFDYDGTEDPLDSSVDTAVQVWGGLWHMPTRAQMQELIDNTTYQWVTNYKDSGINGGTFTATNGAVLFIPAAGSWSSGRLINVGDDGNYWCSSPSNSNSPIDKNKAYYLYFRDGLAGVDNFGYDSGYSVRPVITSSNTLHKVSVTGDYNDLINKPVIPEVAGDDAARAYWGGDWRMPTNAEFQALGNAVNTEWTTDYQGSYIAGLVCTDKTDSSKTLFFPAAGRGYKGNIEEEAGNYGYYWSSSLFIGIKQFAYGLCFSSNNASWDSYGDNRCLGCSVRPILDGANANGHDYVEIGGIKWATMNIGAFKVAGYGLYFQWGDIQGYTLDQVGNRTSQKYFGWADYKYGNGTSSHSATDMTKYNATDGKTVLELFPPVKYIHKVAVSGDYNDLENRPVIPDNVVIEAPLNTTDNTAPITTLTCEISKYYRIDVAVNTLAVTLPAMTNNTTVKSIVLFLHTDTNPAVTFTSTAPTGSTAPTILYQENFGFDASSYYEVNCLWNGLAWVVAAVKIVASV